MREAICVEDLSVKLSGHFVVKSVSLQVSEGEIVSIIGPNGSGKTTLIKAMSRLLRMSSGTISFFGSPIESFSTIELARILAILPQSRNFYSDLTVEKLVSYGRHPHLKFGERLNKDHMDIIDWAMNITGMESYRHRYLETLSGGEQQRAWIAMALAQRPKILILDEPTTFLDVAHQLEVLEIVRELNRQLGLTVVMVLHDINHAIRFSDSLCAMKEGRLLKKGSSKEMLDSKMLREIYQIEGRFYFDEKNECPFVITDRVTET